ncbi:MAG: RpiB/LacA/LacB family sugar-phosphate isomerase [Candidatus Chisholmbacteria bacterium]|nr:RpiB/LacA/LacB family sugar-phosphate isomerase [Candidatus Chisholmbacteria bacterium]
MKIFLGADHRGFRLKEQLKNWLEAEGHEVVDMGNYKYDPEDDFPDFAVAVGERVVKGEGIGILMCGSGGMALAANKIKGVRAVEVWDEERGAHALSHDRVNVLALPADVVDVEMAKKIIKAGLATLPRTEEKYERRLKKIDAIETRFMR